MFNLQRYFTKLKSYIEKQLLIFKIYFICLGISLACISLYQVCIQNLEKPGKGIRFPGAGDIDNCEVSCKWWEVNLRPLEGRAFLASEPSLQPWNSVFVRPIIMKMTLMDLLVYSLKEITNYFSCAMFYFKIFIIC